MPGCGPKKTEKRDGCPETKVMKTSSLPCTKGEGKEKVFLVKTVRVVAVARGLPGMCLRNTSEPWCQGGLRVEEKNSNSFSSCTPLSCQWFPGTPSTECQRTRDLSSYSIRALNLQGQSEAERTQSRSGEANGARERTSEYFSPSPFFSYSSISFGFCFVQVWSPCHILPRVSSSSSWTWLIWSIFSFCVCIRITAVMFVQPDWLCSQVTAIIG